MKMTIPILQGHNPNMKEDFISFEESAWQNKKLNIDKVILESSPLISYNRLMTISYAYS